MVQRFQIEDLLSQDDSGVVFRAQDLESGNTVAVRRFFPFGVEGGGLQREEQAAYEIAVKRLTGLNHPALRAVVCGGCDPVDGMPFIATEWIDGRSLEAVLEYGPLTVDVAVDLIGHALEVCELLSHVFVEEAVWVETEPRCIILGSEESGRGFTFWISPFKWLGTGESRGYEAIIRLTERMLGWTRQVVGDQAGRGLGGWIKWLRNAPGPPTLHEVREMLAASVGAAPPVGAPTLIVQAAKPLRKPSRRGVRFSRALAGLGIALVLTGIGGWLSVRIKTNRAMAPPVVSHELAVESEPVEEEAAALVEPVAMSSEGIRKTVVFSDDFSSGNALDPGYQWDARGNKIAVRKGVLTITDANSEAVTIDVKVDQFTTTTFAEGDIFTISCDVRVNSWSSANGLSFPRIVIFNNGSFDESQSGEIYSIGFGTNDPSADSPVGFYQSAKSGVEGKMIEPPACFVSGGDGGLYSRTAAENSTRCSVARKAVFYRISFDLTQGSNLVTNGTISRLEKGVPTADVSPVFTWTLDSKLAWGDTGPGESANDGLRIMTGWTGTANVEIDNLVITHGKRGGH